MGLILKLRKKLLRLKQHLLIKCLIIHHDGSISRCSPKYKLDYLRAYRHYVRTLEFEVSYE